MKKIYMILAAMTLLSMSLNAQFDATKKVARHTTTAKKADMPLKGTQKAISNATGNNAPSRAPKMANRGTMTWSWVGADNGTTLPSGWTLTDPDHSSMNANGDGTWYIGVSNDGSATAQSITIPASVFQGCDNVTVVVRAKIDTGYSGKSIAVNGSSKSLSNTLTDYTWENVSTTNGVLIEPTDGYVGFASIIITGEIDSNDETICNGTNTNGYLPIYGIYCDDYQINQMIYPENLLTNLVGKTLTSMTFYATAALDANLSSVGWDVKLGTTTQASFASTLSSITRLVPDNVTTVAQGYVITSGINTMTITFTTPFTYNGGNLLVDFQSNAEGQYKSTNFYGVNQSTNTGYNSYRSNNAAPNQNGHYSNGGVRQFLPKVTFTYEKEDQHDLAIALSAPAQAGAGNTVDVIATVTNNGDFAENGYTVTVSDGTNIVNITAQEELGIGETATFTVQFATSANAGGSTVNYTATVACTDDADATNNSATASTSLLACPPPINVVAVPDDNQNATVTWNAPNIPQNTVTEGFDNTAVFTPFSIGGITASVHTGTIGGWTVYTPSSNSVYAYNNASFDNAYQPQAWTVFNTSMSGSYDTHSGNQVMLSFCDAGTGNGQGILTTDHWLISPELSGGAQTITFWERVITDQYGAETFEVLASSTDNNPASFSNVQTYSSTSTGWGSHTATLPAGTKYFAIHHTSYDIFGLMIDDVTYIAPSLQPTSYNVYLDGQLMGSVNASDPLSYDFSNLAVGNHTVEISAVYPLGESALVPYTFTITAKTATPSLSMVDNGDGTFTITATATSPDTDAEVTLNVTGQQPVTGTGSASITITQGNNAQNVTATATALATDKLVSEEASENYTIPALPITPTPDINYEVNGDNVVITATGQGTVTLTIGNETVSGQGSASITLPRTEVDQTVTATATAQATNHQVSATETEQITIPALPQTAAPSIAISSQTDDEVTITATGNGTVILNIPGYEPATGNGSASITVPRHMSDYVVTATATAQASGELVSTTTTQNITVPGKGNDGWIEMTETYNNPNDLLSFKVKVGNDTTDIMLIDQFLAPTIYNDHPSSYTYVLKETKVINGVDSTMTSNPATIPVYKTNSTMRGLYTEAQVLSDDYADEANRLTANAVNGEMDYDVVPDNNVLYYSLYRGGIQEETPVVDVDHRISQLQKFEDKVGDNVTYYFTENHPTGILPRYDHEDNIGSQTVERLDVDYVTGETHDQMSYVPVIWTFGLYTARGDGKNNSYGSDIKVNELGGVNVSSKIVVNWGAYNKLDVDGKDYYVVAPIITLEAVAPELVKANDDETYKYEPYMYRVWCTYKDAHKFGHAVVDGHKILVDAGELPDIFPIGEVMANTLTNSGIAVIGDSIPSSTDWEDYQWAFAAAKEAVTNGQIEFVVRYYYKKVVTEPASPDQPAGMRGNRDGGADYAIYETRTSSSDIVTGVNELWSGYGKIVISQTYVNAQGMQSDKPFDGLNIVVTRFSDGTTTTTKVVR